jgi:hypothetical protein
VCVCPESKQKWRDPRSAVDPVSSFASASPLVLSIAILIF